MRFKEKSHLDHIKVQDEAARADVEAAVSYTEGLGKIIHGDDYTKPQIFNVDKVGFYWKRIPSRTFTASEEMSVPD